MLFRKRLKETIKDYFTISYISYNTKLERSTLMSAGFKFYS